MGALDHLIIYAPMGLGEAAQRAIRSWNRTWTKGGARATFSSRSREAATSTRSACRLGSAPNARNCWPDQAPKFGQAKHPSFPRVISNAVGRTQLLGQVNAELASRQRPPILRLEELTPRFEGTFVQTLRACRKHGGVPPPVNTGFALRLHFAEPVVGPITLGYASHFGLGLS